MKSGQVLYNENSIMKYGTQYKGKRFSEIPPSYWLWVRKNRIWQMDLSLHGWIEDNLEQFEQKSNT